MESRFLSTVVVQLPRIVRRRWSNDFRERWGTHACVRWPRTKLIRKLSRRRRGARRGKAAMRIHHEDSPRARRASPSVESWLFVSAKGEKKKKEKRKNQPHSLFSSLLFPILLIFYRNYFFFLPPGIFIRCNFFFHPLLSSSLLLHFSLFLPSFLSLFLIRSSRLKRAEPRATHPSPRPSSVTICPAFQPDDAARTIDRNDRV